MSNKLNFSCRKCRFPFVSVVERASTRTYLSQIFDNGEVISQAYPVSIKKKSILHFECGRCGDILKNENGPITDYKTLSLWLKTNK